MLLDMTWRLARPLLFSLDAETAHQRVLSAAGRTQRIAAPLLRRLTPPPHPSLGATIGGLRVASPIGLAAGLDKDGEATTLWPALGFGFVELGTVTALPQPGNPRPRLFRLVQERGLINRMGFNNQGSLALSHRLGALRDTGRWPDVPIGANIGKSKLTPLDQAPEDYLLSVSRLRSVVDWITVNVSSPNTPGLRSLQHSEPLRRLLDAIVPAAGTTPLWLKLAPDLAPEALAQAVDIAIDAGCAAIVATNTTRSRPQHTGRLDEEGGLSGAPLWPLARERIAQVIQAAAGRVPVVGVGGVFSAQQAGELLDLGCAAVQLYSGLIFEGPGLPGRLNRDLLHNRRVRP